MAEYYSPDKKADDAVGSVQFETSSGEKNITDLDNVPRDDVEQPGEGFTVKETKKLLRKMDRYLLPFLALLYLLSFLDRTNIGNAKLAGLEEDLKMTGEYDYNVRSSTLIPSERDPNDPL